MSYPLISYSDLLVFLGPDASPIVLPLREAGMEHHRTLSHLPQDPPLQSAPRSRLIVSWWEREVHVWRLRKPLRDLVDQPDGESAVEKNRKLLARILIKGEANITSATVSQDGSLLVVSTTSDIKAFYLRTRSEAKKDEIKIFKVEMPEEFAKQGATRVQISPDGRWLCAIQGGGKAFALSILRDSASNDKPVIHPKTIRLHRIERKVQKNLSLGGLGLYDRTITHIAFSPDSKMLAVADLAGYIDTWVLKTPQPTLQNGANGVHDDVSGSEDEEQYEEGTEGPRWTRNPNGSLIPKLQAAPTVLSFSNHIPKSQPSTTNDDDEIADDYTLLTVTAKPQVLLINPSIGLLAAWSRRNPIARFPIEFRNTRDLVKGALWAGERVWLYGNSFVFMLDIAQDLAKPAQLDDSSNKKALKHGTKRKRGPDTGAGNKMEIGAAGPTKVICRAKGESTEEIALDGSTSDPIDEDEASQAAGESESDDSDEDIRGELALLRGGQGKSASESQPTTKKLAFWHTYKYRPIMGIIPLVTEEDIYQNGVTGVEQLEKRRETIEVALVERPLWDVEMPDRYFGDGEFEK